MHAQTHTGNAGLTLLSCARPQHRLADTVGRRGRYDQRQAAGLGHVGRLHDARRGVRTGAAQQAVRAAVQQIVVGLLVGAIGAGAVVEARGHRRPGVFGVGALRALVQQQIVVAEQSGGRLVAVVLLGLWTRLVECAGAGADVRRMAERVHGGRLDAGGRHALPRVLLVIGQRVAAGEIEAPAVAGPLLMFADLAVEEPADRTDDGGLEIRCHHRSDINTCAHRRHTYVLNSSFSTGPNRSRFTLARAGRLGDAAAAAAPTLRAADRTGDRMRQKSDSSDGFSTRALMLLMMMVLSSSGVDLIVCASC